ncbi:MAG TPA: energy transducer TonB [Opitutaceae bacterium]|nr:energy transducer TonB [Opitutaceae bacterium]
MRCHTASALVGLLLGLGLAGCASELETHSAEVEQINAITRTPARTENETPEQRHRRAQSEEAFGEPIGLMSTSDAYDPPRLTKYVAPELPPRTPLSAPPAAEVAVIIDTSGHVAKAKVISASEPILEGAALAAVRQWQFTPGRKNGELIGMSFVFPIPFKAR